MFHVWQVVCFYVSTRHEIGNTEYGKVCSKYNVHFPFLPNNKSVHKLELNCYHIFLWSVRHTNLFDSGAFRV